MFSDSHEAYVFFVHRLVSAGDDHSIAITADGAVWSWGGGAYGKLGHGDEQNQLLPKKVDSLTGQRVAAVSAGTHSLALTADGAVWSWGGGGYGQLGRGDREHQFEPQKSRCGRAGRRRLLPLTERTAAAGRTVIRVATRTSGNARGQQRRASSLSFGLAESPTGQTASSLSKLIAVARSTRALACGERH